MLAPPQRRMVLWLQNSQNNESSFQGEVIMKFTLPKRLFCAIPGKVGVCARYAQSELIRLLAKLGTKVSVAGKNKGLLFTLGDADKISVQSLLNAVYTLID